MSDYSISWKARDQLLYCEGERTVAVHVEDSLERPIADPIGAQHIGLWSLVVYTKSIRQWDNGDPITQAERQRIAGNISQALTTTGTKHVLHEA